MAKDKKLAKDDQDIANELVKQTLQLAHGNKPGDHAKAEDGVSKIYQHLKQEPPQFIWTRSPFEMSLHRFALSRPNYNCTWVEHEFEDQNNYYVQGYKFLQGRDHIKNGQTLYHLVNHLHNDIGKDVKKNEFYNKVFSLFEFNVRDQLSNWIYEEAKSFVEIKKGDNRWKQIGQNVLSGLSNAIRIFHEIFSLSAASFTASKDNYKEKDLINAFLKIAQNCSWFIPDLHVCWMSERPNTFNFVNNEYHADGKPAIAWEDGFSLWAMHGVRIPRWLAENKDTDIDPHKIMEITNAEVRREFVRKVGIDRVCYALNAQVKDKSDDGRYELIILELPDGRKRPYLKMLNPSLDGVWHVEGVHPNCDTVLKALAWRDGEEVYEKPIILT